MKKRKILVFGIIILLVIILILIRTFSYGGEDNWIKDSKGVYVKHGNPSNTPDYVKEQQIAIEKAQELFQNEKNSGANFSSQCLGTTGDYAVDIVHVPRTSEDNLPANQCADYADGKVGHFIELDKEGNIVRIM